MIESLLSSLTLSHAFSMISLIVGVLIGEYLTYRIFGKPKAWAVFIDLIVFIFVLSTILTSFTFTDSGLMYYITNIVIGAFSITLVRAIEAPLGLTERDIKQEKAVINIVRELSRHGLDKGEIKDVLKKSGFSPSVVKQYENIIDDHAPKYLTRMVKVERLVDEMKDSLDRLENHIIPEEEEIIKQLKKTVTRIRPIKYKLSKTKKKIKRKTKTTTRTPAKLYKKAVKTVKVKSSDYVHPIRRIAMERNLLTPKKIRPRKRKTRKVRKIKRKTIKRKVIKRKTKQRITKKKTIKKKTVKRKTTRKKVKRKSRKQSRRRR
jgi:hypothetical protein